MRPFCETDHDAFARLNSDPEVMADLGGPLPRAKSDAKLARYMTATEQNGFGRMAVTSKDKDFLGYAGIMRRHIPALGNHVEIGWRLKRSAWGNGYAPEAAHAALADAFTRCGLQEVLAYTGPSNRASQSVMRKLTLLRRKDLDFSMELDGLAAPWHGLVWSISPDRFYHSQPAANPT